MAADTRIEGNTPVEAKGCPGADECGLKDRGPSDACYDCPEIPDWQRRAEAKEFRVGDVVWHRQGPVAGHGLVTVEYVEKEGDGDGDAVRWNIGGPCTHSPPFDYYAASKNLCSLLRPVDWQPRVGDRVVCIDRWAGDAIGGGYTIAKDDDVPVAKQHYAPAVLAEPLIPLLCWEGDLGMTREQFEEVAKVAKVAKAIQKCNACGRATFDIDLDGAGCCMDCADKSQPTRDIEAEEHEAAVASLPHVEPCPRCNTDLGEAEACERCGWPGLRSVKGTRWQSKVTDYDRCGLSDAVGRVKFLEDVALVAANLKGDIPPRTLREQRHRERWTATYYTPLHCKRCGSDRGCMCGRDA
jgi:hypothetical protein